MRFSECQLWSLETDTPPRTQQSTTSTSIHVGAAVDTKDLDKIREQLKVGGRLIAPVDYGHTGQWLVVVCLSQGFAFFSFSHPCTDDPNVPICLV
jgi:protein-L-isoaspartate O-methyltransferase